MFKLGRVIDIPESTFQMGRLIDVPVRTFYAVSKVNEISTSWNERLMYVNFLPPMSTGWLSFIHTGIIISRENNVIPFKLF